MIEVKNLTKKYGDFYAVKDLSFTVEDGQIYGFLGPNGAGKSTTMNIITGYLSSTEGSVSINGHDIFEEPEEAKREIGYLPEQPPLYMDMKVDEYLRFVADLKKVPASQRDDQLQEVMGLAGIDEMSHRAIRNLSKGYRQRVGIAQALIGKPSVIILDEPTVGLDPLQVIEIRNLIHSLGKKHTVILSSHVLSEIAAVCDKVLIIAHGQLVAQDTPENLSTMMRGANSYDLLVKGGREAVKAALADIGAEKTEISAAENGCVRVHLETPSDTDPRERLFYALAAAKCPLYELRTTTLSLEEVFLELTTGDTEAAPDEAKKKAMKAYDSDAGKKAAPAEKRKAAETASPAGGKDGE